MFRQSSQAASTTLDQTNASSVSLSTDQPQYAPGQPITITLKNHGRTPIALDRDPAFQIEQGERVIYAPVAALGSSDAAARTLEPGQQVTWTWDQYTLSGQAPSGDYLIETEYQVGQRTEQLTTAITVTGS